MADDEPSPIDGNRLIIIESPRLCKSLFFRRLRRRRHRSLAASNTALGRIKIVGRTGDALIVEEMLLASLLERKVAQSRK